MRFTDYTFIDPVISIGISVFILINAVGNLKEITNLFLEKTPKNIDVSEVCKHILETDGVLDVHHVHVWSIDGEYHRATMHIVADCNFHNIKEEIRKKLFEYNISHVTIETETSTQTCHEKTCKVPIRSTSVHEHCHSHTHRHSH